MRFRYHAVAFLIVTAVLHVANAVAGSSWWAFWPLVGWGMILLAHYLVHRARRVDERWVEQRTEEVLSKSYDRAHIDSIEKRFSQPEEKK
jgi:hypothetical protein